MLLGNAILLDAISWLAESCAQLQIVALCYWGMQLQIASRTVMV